MVKQTFLLFFVPTFFSQKYLSTVGEFSFSSERVKLSNASKSSIVLLIWVHLIRASHFVEFVVICITPVIKIWSFAAECGSHWIETWMTILISSANNLGTLVVEWGTSFMKTKKGEDQVLILVVHQNYCQGRKVWYHLWKNCSLLREESNNLRVRPRILTWRNWGLLFLVMYSRRNVHDRKTLLETKYVLKDYMIGFSHPWYTNHSSCINLKIILGNAIRYWATTMHYVNFNILMKNSCPCVDILYHFSNTDFPHNLLRN